METPGTIFYRSPIRAEKIMQAVAALAEGVNIRKVARIFGVDTKTVLGWLVEAASHTEAVSRYMLHDLYLDQVQLDELYALLSQMGGEEQEEGEDVATRKRRRRFDQWVWAAIDPVSKLLLAVVVGDRSLATAQMLVHMTIQILARATTTFACRIHPCEYLYLSRYQRKGPARPRSGSRV
jgi:transposase-like protein